MQAPGMPSYKLPSNTYISSRPDNADAPPQRTISTRLPTRKTIPKLGASETPLQPSPSKLTKRRPGHASDSNASGRTANIRNEASTRTGDVKSSGTQIQSPPTFRASKAARAPLQTRTYVPTSARSVQSEPRSDRTPSLISGSSASISDSPKSNVLRRKPSSIGKVTSGLRKASTNSQEDSAVIDTLDVLGDPFPDSILGVAMPFSSAEFPFRQPHIGSGSQMAPYSDGFVTAPAPAPTYTLSTTPSTGYSGSPGPFSIASTPTSMSSYSPATTVTSKAPSRTVQSSPVRSRPPVVRRSTADSQDMALPSVRESSASSSNSTTRASAATLQSLPVQGDAVAGRPRTSYDRPNDKAAVDARPKTAFTPPELAHLADARPLQQAFVPIRPVRPSRENTPDYLPMREPSPIIQSNLQRLPSSGHRRQGSWGPRAAGTSSAPVPNRPRIVPPTKLASRNPSPSPSQTSIISPASSRQPMSRGMTPDLPSDAESRAQKGRAPASPGKSTSRFGFFRRKTEPATAVSTAADKKPRKGPAAGTGHEGYGRYGLTRGRSGSTTSGGSSGGRSPSMDSIAGNVSRTFPSRKSSLASKGTPEIDDFLRERLTPVPLRGEGPVVAEYQHSQTAQKVQAATSASQAYPSVSGVSASSPPLAVTSPQPTILQPPPSVQPLQSVSPVKRERSVPIETQNTGRFGFRTMGGKRLSRVSVSAEGRSLTAPSPIPQSSSSSSLFLGTQTSLTMDTTKRGATHPPLKQPGKLTRKWNFFQRSHSTAPKEEPVLEPSPEIRQQQSNRSMAHYALVEERGKIEMDELEQIMQEANESPDEMDVDDNMEGVDPNIILLPEEDEHAPVDFSSPVLDAEKLEFQELQSTPHRRSILLPDRPLLPPPGFELPNRSASPKVQLQRDSPDRYVLPSPERVSPILTTVLDKIDAVDNNSPTSPLVAMPPQRPSRLQQVGRIPQVKRDRERKLSIHSFSRPFGNDGSPAVLQQSPTIDAEPIQALQIEDSRPTALGDVIAQLRVNSFADDVASSIEQKRFSSQTATTIDATTADGMEDFLTFPPRKDSDFSASTSSGHPSFKTILATAPSNLPLAIISTEDEVWKEYDDLIDDVLWTPEATGSLFGKRPSPLSLAAQRRTNAQRNSNTRARGAHDAANPSNDLNNGISRFVPSLPPIATPNSPYSVTDFLAAYGVRGLSMSTVDTTIQRFSNPAGVRTSTGSTRLSLPSSSQPGTSQATTLTSSPSASPKDVTGRYDIRARMVLSPEIEDTSDCETSSSFDDEEENPSSMADLRFGALMTSKWLSFGRVLFSPAHEELKDPQEDRVLVVDGLGKDWSHYVALTYPNASVYSLGQDPSLFPSANPNVNGTSIEQMPNHRHIHHPNLNAPFPFPKGFFAAVVFRFPIIASESAYRMALAESKRVLRPGGYLELSVLDMDPVNMGNHARKAVKGLKMRLAQQHPEYSLKPMSDVLMKLLGRRGFEGLQRCVVGVPAAGPIKLGGAANIAHMPSISTPDSSSLAPPSASSGSDSFHRGNLTFTDLLHSTQDESANSGLSRMVCKVGRWWYEKCYESAALEGASTFGAPQSIWRDEALLTECEQLNTTFRLLICCAQKPTGAVRRTVSV